MFPQQTLITEAAYESETAEYTVIAEQLKQFSAEVRPLVLVEEGHLIYSPFSYYLALLSLEPGLNSDQQELFDTALLPNGFDRNEYFSILASFLEKAMTNERPAFQTQTYLLGGLDKMWSDDYRTSVEHLATVLKLVDFSKFIFVKNKPK